MQRSHIVLSTNSDALKGFEGHLRQSHMAEEVLLLQFSEQKALSRQKLRQAIGDPHSCEIWVLLLATGQSSHLWFNAEHCPKNVELCSWLTSHAEIRYVICPTSPTAKMDWPDSETRPLPMIKQVFGDYLPKNFDQVSCWHGFEAGVRSSSTILDLTEVAVAIEPVPALRIDAWRGLQERFWFGLGVAAVSSGVLCLLWSMRRRIIRLECILPERLAALESQMLRLQDRTEEQALIMNQQAAKIAFAVTDLAKKMAGYDIWCLGHDAWLNEPPGTS